MFFTKVSVNSGPAVFEYLDAHGRKGLYSDHQLLWQIFPVKSDAKRDFLFRKETKYNYTYYYVVSKRQPVNSIPMLRLQIKEYNPIIKKGQEYEFTLMANPVISKKSEGKKNSSHHDVWMNAKHEGKKSSYSLNELSDYINKKTKEWIIRRAENHGFTINPEHLNINSYLQHRFFKRKAGKPILMSTVDYNGILKVINAGMMKKTLFEGIGKAKAFGCGLLLIKKI